MGITNMMGKPLKHYAVDKNTRARYFILALENETDPETCSVIEMDKMESELRAELKEIVDSDDCQREVDIWRLLDTKFFMNYPKQTILSVLRALKVIKNVSTEEVLVILPNDTQMTAKEVMSGIREYREKQKQKRLGYISDTENNLQPKLDNKELESVKEEVNNLKEVVSNMATVVSSLKDLISEMKPTKSTKK